MRVVTWNINGVRTLSQYHPWNSFKTFDEILNHLEADIICFQEMKITRQALPKAIALPPSFDSFFSFPFRKNGYSGCAVYTRRTCAVPLKAEEGLTGLLQSKPPLAAEEKVSGAGMYPPDVGVPVDKKEDGEEGVKVAIDYKTLDSEGRAVVLDLGLFVLINTYCPNDGTGTEERDLFKMQYHRMLQTRVESLIREGREVMLVGDINACAAIEDHCEGQLMVEKGWAEGLEGEEGFWGKESRRWMRDLISHEGEDAEKGKGKLVDIVRKFWPDRKGMYTCWNTKISARDTNYGTRIDFILITPGLVPWIKAADIQPEIKGSDHCPVFVDFHDEIVITSSNFTDGTPTTIKLQDVLGARPVLETGELADPPRIAAKYWDEYKQKLLSNFFGKKAAGTPTPTAIPKPKPTKALFTLKPSAGSVSASQDTIAEASAGNDTPAASVSKAKEWSKASASKTIPIASITKSKASSSSTSTSTASRPRPISNSKTMSPAASQSQSQEESSESASTSGYIVGDHYPNNAHPQAKDNTVEASADTSVAMVAEPPLSDESLLPQASPETQVNSEYQTQNLLLSKTQTQSLTPAPTLEPSASSSSSSISTSAPDTPKLTFTPNVPEKMSKRKRDLASITIPVKKAKVSKSSSDSKGSSSSFLSEMTKNSGKKTTKEMEPKGKAKASAKSILKSDSASSSSLSQFAHTPKDATAGSSTSSACTPIDGDADMNTEVNMEVDEDADYLLALQLSQSEDNMMPEASSSQQSQGEGSSISERYRKGRMRSPIRLPPPRANGHGKEQAINTGKDKDKEQDAKQAWTTLFGPIQAPLCFVHQEPAKEYTVNKPGPNKGRKFFTCSRSVGPGYDKGYAERPRDQVDPQWKCNFFKWSSDVRKETARNLNSNSPSKSNGNGSSSV